MRFVKEMLHQMGQDLNWLVGGYGAITAYVIATLSVMTLTVVIFSGIDFPNTPAGRGTGIVMFAGTLILEFIVSCWIWGAGTKAKKKIAEENEEVMKTLRANPETYR